MKKIWTIIPVLMLVALIGTACHDEEETNGNGNNSTNVGDDEDLVENQTWNTAIDIIWNGTDVTVSGSADGVTISTNNGYVAIQSTAKHVIYNLSGSGTGQLSVYSDYKYQLALQGLTLTCSDGPAINCQSHKRCYLVIAGTNSLTDGATYATTTEDRKATIFCEDKLCISGNGSLSVTGNYKHSIASDDYIRLCPNTTATLTLTANASDGLHANDGIIINDGQITITAKQEGIQCDTSSIVISGGKLSVTSQEDKGILAYGNIEISGGDIFVTSPAKCIKTKSNLIVDGGTIKVICTGEAQSGGGPGGGGPGGGGRPGDNTESSGNAPEGIEAKGTITINNGQVYSQAADDAINSGSTFSVNGGLVCAYSTNNDGLDANGNCIINGGVVYAIGSRNPEVGIDANTEERFYLTVNGGTIVAIGGLERNSKLNQTCYYTSSWSTSTWYALTVGDNTFAFKTPASGGTKMVVSGAQKPTLKKSVTASGTTIFNGMGFYPATCSGGSEVSLSQGS